MYSVSKTGQINLRAERERKRGDWLVIFNNSSNLRRGEVATFMNLQNWGSPSRLGFTDFSARSLLLLSIHIMQDGVEEWKIIQLFKEFPASIQPDHSLACLQKPTTVHTGSDRRVFSLHFPNSHLNTMKFHTDTAINKTLWSRTETLILNSTRIRALYGTCGSNWYRSNLHVVTTDV
jgi:hypothetical protein